MKSPFFLISFAGICAAVAYAQTNPLPVNSTAPTTLAPVQLRGYGLVSGSLKRAANNGSVLRIDTESSQKAQLLQAKFLSDFGLLPRVQKAQLAVGNANVPIQEAEQQGAVAALRDGKTVFLIAAKDRAQLTATIKTLPAAALQASGAAVAVPMWLDRWDKFGFRHYYRPWERPADTTDANYDYLAEFDYAKSQQRAGFVFWNDVLTTDSADGLYNSTWWNWAQREAKKRDLPVGINSNIPESTWLMNRFQGETELKMPDFTGNFRDLMTPYLGGQGIMSWNSQDGKDAQLGLIQNSLRQYANDSNVTTFLEPHGELHHGPQDIFLEYGPVADAGYRRFLHEKYATPAALSARWNRDIKTWDDVRVPEVASFAGWNAAAIDLGGNWRVGYEELLGPAPSGIYYDRLGAPASKPAPEHWYAPDFDDASWPELRVPGNDKQMFLVKRPAIFRRNFEVADDWKTKNPRAWLYLWDLDGATDGQMRVVVNGKEVGRDKIAFFTPHWNAYEVTDALKSGQNSVAIRLPQGYIAYKTYLSATPPLQYPALGEALNAQWVDFSDFTQWSRVSAARRGVEMIRQIAPNHSIVFMAPTNYADGVKKLATQYGGEFHDTGFMGAFWADYPSSVMRGADLPFSLEPGNPAGSLEEWKKQMGYYQTEGVQGIDYFIHIGDIMWKPEIRADYEAHRSQISLLGQSHFAKAQVGVLYSDRIAQLTGFPWGAAPNTNLAGGYWAWNAGSVLRGNFPYDGLTQSSFANGEADPYRVVVDTNTSIMDEKMVTDIEKWVRAGGTFVTLAQTGRHTPEKPDAWPIERLTGYQVTKIDRLKENGDIDEAGNLQIAPDQKVFDASWNGVAANGLHLRKVAPDAQNLLLWNNGDVAAGVRSVGKGFIVQLGAKFAGAKIFDRVEPGGNTLETQALRRMLTSVLDWRGVARDAAQLTEPNEQVILRPAVTNNGLYETWTLFNQSRDQKQTVAVQLAAGRNPEFAFDARDGKAFPIVDSPDGARLENIVLEPLETRVFLTPRGQIESAPLAWFDLQRRWWRGTTAPAAKTLPAPTSRTARDLTPDWKFQTIAATADASPLAVAAFDDKNWSTRPLGIWNTKETGDNGHGVFRKTFTVPRDWNTGKVSLWMTSWYNTSFIEGGRVWLDGQEVKGLNADAYLNIAAPTLTAGSSHTLAVEIKSAGVLAGLRGECWISYEPNPAQKIDLAGQWQPSSDGLKYQAPVALPGAFNAQFLKREIFIDAKYRGQNAVVNVQGARELIGVIINGRIVRRHHHLIGDRWSLNLTPFVRFGASNEIELVRWDGSGAGEVRELSLGFFDPRQYPGDVK